VVSSRAVGILREKEREAKKAGGATSRYALRATALLQYTDARLKGVNQIAKLAGRGKDDSLSNNGGMQNGLNHSSAPLSTLKDPASFGPPPRHVAVGGAQAPTASSSGRASVRTTPTPRQTTEPQWQAPAAAEDAQLQTPSTRRVPIQSPQQTGTIASTRPTPAARPAPPPRPSLPPRQNSRPDLHTPEPPPSYNASVQEPGEQDGYVNQASVGRLGRAGVNMSAFSTTGQGTEASASTGAQGHPGQMSELQARFSKLKPSTSQSSETAPVAGTSWAQKQQAVQTASKFRADPSSVSLSDARDAASTANSFRQRHGDQVSAGWKAANSFNQQHAVTDRFGGTSTNSHSSQPAAEQVALPGPSSSMSTVTGKRPPPPPPKKKELQSSQSAEPGGPPPIPMSSKPRV
jgi:hypothetical protein